MNIPIVLTIVAGLASILGALFGLYNNKPSNQSIAFSLGFAAGIMLMVALCEMLPATFQATGSVAIYGYLSFVIGLVGFYGLNYILPHDHPIDLIDENQVNIHKMKNAAFLLTIGISLHNFPEGMATFLSATKDLELGIGVALAVGIHNFPEGLAVAVPVYIATKSRKKALFWSSIAAFSEILGGITAYLLFKDGISEIALNSAMAGVAGIMVALSIDELMPLSKSLAPNKNPSFGVFCGMVMMGLSLVLLKLWV